MLFSILLGLTFDINCISYFTVFIKLLARNVLLIVETPTLTALTLLSNYNVITLFLLLTKDLLPVMRYIQTATGIIDDLPPPFNVDKLSEYSLLKVSLTSDG